VPDDRYLDIQNLDAGYGRSQVLFGVNCERAMAWRRRAGATQRNRLALMENV